MYKRLSPYFEPSRKAMRLALPIIAGQLGQILMGFFDTVQIGGLGPQYIAAVGFSNNVFWMLNLLGIGIFFSVSPLVSEAIGAGEGWKAIGVYRSSLLLMLPVSVVFISITAFIIAHLHWFGQSEVTNELSGEYLWWLLPSVPLVFYFNSAKQFLDGQGRTNTGMYITISGLALNVLLNQLLIYGWRDVPALGIKGAALATGLSRVYMGLAFLLVIATDKRVAELRARFRNEVEHPAYAEKILRLGIPAGLQFFLEVSAFSIAQIMAGWINDLTLAAHQIAINLASVTFMVITGISAAGSIMTGYAFGAKDREQIRIAGNTAIGLVLLFEIAFALFFLFGHQWLPYLYTRDEALVSLSARLILWGALFQISDGLQNVAVGVLRGIQDVFVPAVLALFSYWGVMVPACYWLAFHTALGVDGIWVGFIIGLSMAAILLLARFFSKRKTVRL